MLIMGIMNISYIFTLISANNQVTLLTIHYSINKLKRTGMKTKSFTLSALTAGFTLAALTLIGC